MLNDYSCMSLCSLSCWSGCDSRMYFHHNDCIFFIRWHCKRRSLSHPHSFVCSHVFRFSDVTVQYFRWSSKLRERKLWTSFSRFSICSFNISLSVYVWYWWSICFCLFFFFSSDMILLSNSILLICCIKINFSFVSRVSLIAFTSAWFSFVRSFTNFYYIICFLSFVTVHCMYVYKCCVFWHIYFRWKYSLL